ncbi:MAG TPA: DMT family transporter [Blastocatellia bacterium]|nr:DMT family transporter [Blastocatellia bacterium]
MSLASVLLALFSACLHVVMHVALKSARDRASFVWWTWLWASLIFLPVPIFFWQSCSALTWAILIISAVFEALYHVAVSKAYKTGDLSVVYPLARGAAPLFILLWSTLLLRERPTIGGLCGVALIVAGLCLVNLRRFGAWRELRQSLWQSGTRWALLAGLCISCYTTLDKAGVRLIAPLLYTYLVMTITLIWLTPGALRAVGWQGLMAEWRSSKYKSMIAGFTAMAAYAIVLYVMWTGAPVSYVGAMREISVVFGAVVGVVFLKEQGTATRVFGSSLIASGVGVIALLG